MASSTSVNPPFLRIGSHQVHLKDDCCKVNVRHILNHIGFLRLVPLWQSTIQRFVALFPTIKEFPLELLLLRDSLFRFQIIAFPIFIGFLELGTLIMFHKVSLVLAQITCPFLLRPLIVFFNVKSNNQIFDAHLLPLMLEVILEVFLSKRQLLYNSYNLKSFTQNHSLSMYLMDDYLKFLT